MGESTDYAGQFCQGTLRAEIFYPILFKTKELSMKRLLCVILAAALGMVPTGRVQAELLGYWSLNDNGLPNGGFGYLADPDIFPLAAVAGVGGATLTVGGGITSETIVNGNGDTVYRWLQSFGGTELNALFGDISGGSLSIQGGTVVDEIAGNSGAYVEFAFSMEGYQDLEVSYATQRTSSGFISQEWSWSTDGVNFTPFQTVADVPLAPFQVRTLDPISDLNNVATAYLRVTVTGATTSAGNNRFDNIQLNAAEIPGGGASVVGSFVYHSAYAGAGSPIDSGKSLFKQGAVPQELTYENLINTAQGLNGIAFDIQGLGNAAALSAADFQFQVSPTGAFNQGLNPPSGWPAGPAPSSVSVTTGSPDQVLIQWPDQSIENRWLRITVLANSNTGLSVPEVYYVGHLLGETTGASEGFYTVSFGDITAIRAVIGQTVTSESIADVDKTGIVNFGDISAMRGNVGAQLTNITVP